MLAKCFYFCFCFRFNGFARHTHCVVGLLFASAMVWFVSHANSQDDAAQRAKDARIVQVLLRLPGATLEGKPEHRAAMVRYLATIRGEEKYFEIIERFTLSEQRDELLGLATDSADGNVAASAARVLVKLADAEFLAKTIAGDEPKAVKLLGAIGLAGNASTNSLLLPIATDAARSLPLRSAAVTAVGKNVPGQKALLALVEQGKLKSDLNFSVGNALFASPDPAVRAAAAKHIKLPATANAEPLPPIAELSQRTGDVVRGQKVFATNGSCAKCHKVGNEGKEVGPNLSEIGSKLSREAFFVSILDPSAGISHGFETYVVATDDGNVVTGILVSDTAEAITLRTAEAIVRTFPKSTVEEYKKQPVSLMPADLQKTMTVQDLVDVVEFLTTLKKKS